jgi:hypothetical protein
MPAFDELRNELDSLLEEGYDIDSAFNELVQRYEQTADQIEKLTLLKQEKERQSFVIDWSPSII